MKPDVTLCTPSYNGAAYLAEAFKSAQAQTNPRFELLLVDDGSTDETLAIARHFSSQDSRIQVHGNLENVGLPGNWDRARQLAAADWILFLFQDDLFAPQYIERMLAAARKHDTPIVCCRRNFIFGREVLPQTSANFLELINRFNFAKIFPNQEFVSAAHFSAALCTLPTTNFIGEPTAVLLHRSLLEEFGTFHPKMRQLVDFEYWARVASNRGIAYVDEPLVTFRFHNASATSANAASSARKDRLDSIILLYDFLHGVHYAALRSQLRNRGRLLRAYVQRVAQLQLPDDQRAPGDPSWTEALAYYPALAKPRFTVRCAQFLFRLRHAAPKSAPSQESK